MDIIPVLIELCRIEISKWQRSTRTANVLIELCRIEIYVRQEGMPPHMRFNRTL